MLTNLSIKNYALIDHLNVKFTNGFTVITGETGAGKSILLGGLSLVLGKRADLSSLREKEDKCIVEAEFEISKYGLEAFFTENDLDYEKKTILRREILPSGKSRAFINDSPVTLDILSELGDQLIDVHSQHQTLRLADNDFQLKVIDALADNGQLLGEYSSKLLLYQSTQKQLQKLVDFQNSATKEHEYNSFLLQELNVAPLKEGILEELEEQYEQLNNVEVILEQLSHGQQLLNDEQIGLINLLTALKQVSNKLASFGHQYSDINERVKSVFIELDDISNEFTILNDKVEADPQLLEQVNAKLQLLYDLLKKHKVQTISELLEIRDNLDEKVSATENVATDIDRKRKELQQLEKALNTEASSISKKRKLVVPKLKSQLEETLIDLGMASATFKIEISAAKEFKPTGRDNLSFLFSANKGSAYGDLKKVASGGELSRIMLTIKAILARYEQLPTMMFDEIDTGVSGEISNKMGDIMKDMSNSMQIFSITHLPQVAAKGVHHFKVYKTEELMGTNTKMKRLTSEERVVELAEMLGGKNLSESALAHARQLLD
ncbi:MULTISPECIES: DNA repair protein RecN [unclassified Arenibacter]|uniref:DNA repair protein RecN n=1 Tax=unclassified Arenibacter TaxID=2615047 RepID=UPI000E341DC6|nr:MULTISPECIES: DNA repair protein RecN [unclassified Arenibacter]MCM4163505.1 DNA repair protein RecN [Arenibacter sp. A80]RFT57497.1 DNA repair protein RecN [Arenibacter sp. P308M17]